MPFCFCFLSDFSSVKIFRGMGATLDQTISAKKKIGEKKQGVRPRDGHLERVCTFSGSTPQKRSGGHLNFRAQK